MSEDLFILHSENGNIVIISDRFRSLSIFVDGEIMYRSIQFNDQRRMCAEKVHDEPTDRYLSSEFESVEFPVSHNVP